MRNAPVVPPSTVAQKPTVSLKRGRVSVTQMGLARSMLDVSTAAPV